MYSTTICPYYPQPPTQPHSSTFSYHSLGEQPNTSQVTTHSLYKYTQYSSLNQHTCPSRLIQNAINTIRHCNIYLFIYLFIYLYIYLFIYLFIYLGKWFWWTRDWPSKLLDLCVVPCGVSLCVVLRCISSVPNGLLQWYNLVRQVHHSR